MTFIKGFTATLAFILLCIVVFGIAGIIGLLLFAQTDSLLAFIAPLVVAIILVWAMHGGFLFWMARKVVGNDD